MQELFQTKGHIKTAGFQLSKFHSNIALDQEAYLDDYGLAN